MAASKASARVVIVGAGPVGMVCALALNRSGISVTVFEQEPEPPIEEEPIDLADCKAWYGKGFALGREVGDGLSQPRFGLARC